MPVFSLYCPFYSYTKINFRVVIGGQINRVILNGIIGELFKDTIDAGFRPGSRGPFVSAKGPKTIDAPFGHIGWEGR
jgi:hypothetical protein